jgi:hypothetical protein
MGGRAGSLDFLPAQLTQLVNLPELLGSAAASVLAGTVVGTLFVRDGDAPALSHRRRIGFMACVPDLCEQLAALLRLPRLWWPYLATGGAAGLLNAAAVTAGMMLIVACANRRGLRLKF